jgi:hypothetical protein
MTPSDSVRILRVGTLGLTTGRWPVIGVHPDFVQREWPAPGFLREAPLGHRRWIVRYSDQDIALVEHEEEITPDADVLLEEDGAYGHEAAEKVLALATESSRGTRPGLQ